MAGPLRFTHFTIFGCCLCLCLVLLVLQVHHSTITVHVVSTSVERSGVDSVPHVDLSLTTDIMERMKFQKAKVDEYCATHPELGSKFNLPPDQDQRDLLYRHLLFDDVREIMFCFVEKIGCTDMKRFMFIAAGVLPERSAQHDWVDLKYLEKGIRKASLLNKNLTEFKRIHKIKNYFKFTILRHPLERFVSGFRNKLEPPLHGLSEKFPNLIKRTILQKYRNKEYRRWLAADGLYNISVSFREFVDHFIQADKNTINPHFKPLIQTCHPCKVRYDFYGNFAHYGSDIRLVAEHFGLSLTWYRNKSLHSNGHGTKTFLTSYYNQLNRFQKLELLESLKDELDFYYSLYPDEKDSHLQFLDVSYM